MPKAHILFILLLTILLSTSGQTSDVCSHENDAAEKAEMDFHQAQHEALGDKSEPHDSGCAQHDHVCCSHHSIVTSKGTTISREFNKEPASFSLYISKMFKAPDLDGPYQPPKA